MGSSHFISPRLAGAMIMIFRLDGNVLISGNVYPALQKLILVTNYSMMISCNALNASKVLNHDKPKPDPEDLCPRPNHWNKAGSFHSVAIWLSSKQFPFCDDTNEQNSLVMK